MKRHEWSSETHTEILFGSLISRVVSREIMVGVEDTVDGWM
jgi:hypothetical protein